MPQKIKVPAHTRNGVKIKGYSYTRGKRVKSPKYQLKKGTLAGNRYTTVTTGPRDKAKRRRVAKLLRKVASTVAKRYRAVSGR